MKKEHETNTALAKNEGSALPAELAGLFNVRDNMEGIEPRLPLIKIVHPAQLFEWPHANDALGVNPAYFDAIIIDITRVNAYWKEDMSDAGAGNPPDCFSMNGVKPDASGNDVQSSDCHACPANQFGSADRGEGRGKACKNMKRIHLLTEEGSVLPYRLSVPPSSLKAVDMYVSILSGQNIPYQTVETRFLLSKLKNKGGIVYSELVLARGPFLTLAQSKAVAELRQQFLGIMRGQGITDEEYAGGITE